MARRSAGILLYRQSGDEPEVLLVHPGGPFWARKDDGAWSIPKGEYADDEDPRAAALREFEEELGTAPPGGADALVDLGEVKQRSGKVVTAYGLEGDLDASDITSNTFEMEWPPKCGRLKAFPEIDRAEWFDLEVARSKILSGQIELIDRLEKEVK